MLACNGRRVPLQPADEPGAALAGVRYKRSSPPATLHPTVPATGELVFDLIDAWTARAIGGYRYVPAVPELAGFVGAPPRAVAPRGGERVLPVLTPLPPRLGRGWFRSGGSGLGPMTPPADAARGWTLDLTVPA